MKTLVVYESMYGNSHRVADLIGARCSEAGPTDVLPVSLATHDLVAGADLLVVGGPTHIHSMSSRKSRAGAKDMMEADAAKHGNQPLQMDPHWQDPGLRDWFKDLPDATGKLAAAFDTRLDARAALTGRASRAIGRKLSRHGYRLIAEPESFLVDRSTELLDSEAERAGHWASGLLTAALAEEASNHWNQ